MRRTAESSFLASGPPFIAVIMRAFTRAWTPLASAAGALIAGRTSRATAARAVRSSHSCPRVRARPAATAGGARGCSTRATLACSMHVSTRILSTAMWPSANPNLHRRHGCRARITRMLSEIKFETSRGPPVPSKRSVENQRRISEANASTTTVKPWVKPPPPARPPYPLTLAQAWPLTLVDHRRHSFLPGCSSRAPLS